MNRMSSPDETFRPSEAPRSFATPCPDWKALAARRDLDPAGEEAWEAALPHLDACPVCRRAALDAEPTLVFRRLGAVEKAVASPSEIDEMRQAVQALRRGRALEGAAAPPSQRPTALRLRAFALAATLVVALGGAFLLSDDLGPGAPSPPPVSDAAEVLAAWPGTDLDDPPPAAFAPRDLRFEIQVLRASSVAAGDIPAAAISAELGEKLRGLLRYDEYEVLATAGLDAREGEDVLRALDEQFQVSFKSGSVLDGRRLRLEGFRVEKAIPSTNKSRRLAPRELFNASLDLWLDRPFAVVLSQDEERGEALVVAITCRPGTVLRAPAEE